MNDTLLLIEQLGLDPSEFEWSETEVIERQYRQDTAALISILTHKHTAWFFNFGSMYVTFSPGPHRRVENHEHRHIWDVKLRLARIWLAELSKELDAPDLWATIGQEKALSTAASSASLDNRPFTAAEQSFIATKLDEIKAHLAGGSAVRRRSSRGRRAGRRIF